MFGLGVLFFAGRMIGRSIRSAKNSGPVPTKAEIRQQRAMERLDAIAKRQNAVENRSATGFACFAFSMVFGALIIALIFAKVRGYL